MALIECKNCGHRVSEHAENCPKCGMNPLVDQEQLIIDQKKRKRRRIRRLRNIGIWIGGFFILYFIVDFIIISVNGCPIFYSVGKPTYQFDSPIVYSDSLKNAAERGNPDAQADLGSYYYDNEKYDEALKWLQASANQNSPKGKHRLANLYWSGDGVPENKTLALNLYEEAAKGGHASSQYFLGTQYLFGNEVEKDELKGMEYLSAAVKQNYVPAEAIYGFVLASPLTNDVPIDNVDNEISTGLTYLKSAADKGYAPAYGYLGMLGMAVSEDTIGKPLLSELRTEATANMKKALDLEDPVSQTIWGFYNKYVLGDNKEGMQWLAKAAQQGHEGAIAEYKKRFLIWKWFN